MALAVTTDFEVRTTGNDNNGGGFNRSAAGTDFSQQDAAQDSGTNLTVDAVTNTDVTPDGYTVSSADVGNVINITSTSPWTPGRYQINSIQGGTKWRLDRSPAAVGSTSGVWYLGGALRSPSIAVYAAFLGMRVYIKNGTYLITSTSANTAGGILQTSGNGNLAFGRIVGYKTTRGEILAEADMPLIQASGISTVTLIDLNHNSWMVMNLKVDGASLTAITGMDALVSSYAVFYNCVVVNCTAYGIYANQNGSMAFRCKVSGCSGTAGISMVGSGVHFCEVFDNTVTGIFSNTVTYCLSYRNRGANVRGIQGIANYNCNFVGNVCFYNQGDGIYTTGSGMCINNILYNNGAYGINPPTYNSLIFNNAFGANSSGEVAGSTLGFLLNNVTLTADPFTNASTSTGGASDFSLNSTAGGGAACKNVGYPTDPIASTDTFNDIGASRHQDPAAGGGLIVHPGMTGGLNG